MHRSASLTVRKLKSSVQSFQRSSTHGGRTTARTLPLEINEFKKKKTLGHSGETLMNQRLNKPSGARGAKRAKMLCKLITFKCAAAE